MNNEINWDSIPEVMTLDEMRQICHISKSTARFLLYSGKVPCFHSGKQTRCYKILKSDVKAYYEDRIKFPEYYMASKGWYSHNYSEKSKAESIPEIREDMHSYYEFLLRDNPDVLTNSMICNITGYSKSIINSWCSSNHLQHFTIGKQNMVPKVYLIDYLCSKRFRTITRKSAWHIKILINYPNWKKNQ